MFCSTLINGNETVTKNFLYTYTLLYNCIAFGHPLTSLIATLPTPKYWKHKNAQPNNGRHCLNWTLRPFQLGCQSVCRVFTYLSKVSEPTEHVLNLRLSECKKGIHKSNSVTFPPKRQFCLRVHQSENFQTSICKLNFNRIDN